jgi:hypothetical protein
LHVHLKIVLIHLPCEIGNVNATVRLT